jgi:hypothetical protein
MACLHHTLVQGVSLDRFAPASGVDLSSRDALLLRRLLEFSGDGIPTNEYYIVA